MIYNFYVVKKNSSQRRSDAAVFLAPAKSGSSKAELGVNSYLLLGPKSIHYVLTRLINYFFKCEP